MGGVSTKSNKHTSNILGLVASLSYFICPLLVEFCTCNKNVNLSILLFYLIIFNLHTVAFVIKCYMD